jgi:DNA-binding beta-propeller fold protein YncE
MKYSVLFPLVGLWIAATAGAAIPTYQLVDKIPIPDGGWDYVTVDAAARRLYLGRTSGVLALDLETRKVTPVLVPGAGVHGAVQIGNTGMMLSTNGRSNQATVFAAASGKVLGQVATGKMPDAAVYEPKTALVVVLNHRGGTATLVDGKVPAVVGTVEIGGVLEFGVADGRGLVYVNVESRHQIAVLDVASQRVTDTIELPGCTEPSGLAYDAADDYLISVCSNGVTQFVHVHEKKVIATLATGGGSDGVIFDADRQLAFVPAATEGKLSVIAFDAHRLPRIVQTVATQQGTRLGGLDPKSGRIYLPSARLGPPVPPDPWPAPAPGSVQLLVVGPQ